jgi:hypothetical protein
MWCLKTNTDAYVCSYNNEASKLAIRDCLYWITRIEQQKNVEILDRTAGLKLCLNLTNGTRIQALPCVAHAFRGKQGLFVLDEFAYYGDEEFFKSILATSIWGGKVAVISTHNGADNFFCKIVERYREQSVKYTFKYAVSVGLYRKICEVSGKTWSQFEETVWVDKVYSDHWAGADEELDCIPRKNVVVSYDKIKKTKINLYLQNGKMPTLESGYLSFFGIKNCIETIKIQERYNGIVNIGVDIGFKKHPTAIVGTSSRCKILFGAYLWGLSPSDVNELIDDAASMTNIRVYADAAGVGYSVTDIAKRRKNVECIFSSHKNKQNFDSVVWQILSGDMPYFDHPLPLEELRYIDVKNNGKVTVSEYLSDISRQHHHCDMLVALGLSTINTIPDSSKIPSVSNW